MALLAGTLAYMAPEMQYTGRATKESDIYAFGILVLEVVCGRRPLNLQAVEPADFVSLGSIWRVQLQAGNIARMADPRISESEAVVAISEDDPCNFEVGGSMISAPEHQKMIAKVLQLRLLCWHCQPSERPSMRLVNQWFEPSEVGAVELPPLPAIKQCCQYSVSHYSESVSSTQS